MASERTKHVTEIILENRGISMSEAMKRAGFSGAYSKNPQQLKRTRNFQEIMKNIFDDEFVARKHTKLLNASRIEHMVFPLAMSDEEIIEILRQKNCTVKKFMHSETQTHVWYFTADNKAQDAALDKLYKLKGQYAAEKHEVAVSGPGLSDLFNNAQKKKGKPNKNVKTSKTSRQSTK